ncbi:hypothetical protein [Burkholderia paludis]|uniref:hypothetical protein n=1 Tax=Burkholderia paludis TaxID=1506587 RepID=UPI00126A04EB|nr:hypothetical protein [Burkholderia paludis]
MSSENVKLFGTDFLGPDGPVMVSENGEITIAKDELGEFVSFSIMNSPIDDYVDFLSNFKIKILSISHNSSDSIIFDFGRVEVKFIERLYLNLQRGDVLKFPSDLVFENLREISVRDGFPEGLPLSDKLPFLKKIAVELFSESDLFWIGQFPDIVDLAIYHYPGKDLMPLAGLNKLKRLCLVEGGVRSLHGIERLSHLAIVHVVSCRRLADVSALLEAKSIEHIMFEKFRGIKNWSFLSKKINLKTVWLEVAESIDFIRHLPNLTYFRCIGVVDENVGVIDEMGFLNLPYRSKVFCESIV